MPKSGLERAADAAQNIKAIKDIIQAALRGGWQAAALEAIKHYWPYVLIAVVVGLLLPVIIFVSLPCMLFGFGSSADADISAMTAQAEQVKGYYSQYESYCSEWVESIKSSHPDTESVQYEIIVEGSPISKNWFVALYSVVSSNDLNKMTESNMKKFVGETMIFMIENKPAIPDDDEERPAPAQKKLTIKYLTPNQVLNHYTPEDRNWVELIYKTLNGDISDVIPGTGEVSCPFPGVDWKTILTSDYGWRTDPISGETRFHSGLDLAMPYGTDIRAAKAGTVTLVQYSNEGYGYHIMIDHGGGMQTLYGHCSELLVYSGQKVEQGQLIARVGSTGYSTGPHCHFEVRVDGQTADPRNYL